MKDMAKFIYKLSLMSPLIVCARVSKLMVVTVGSSPKCIKTLGRTIPRPALGCVKPRADTQKSVPLIPPNKEPPKGRPVPTSKIGTRKFLYRNHVVNLPHQTKTNQLRIFRSIFHFRLTTGALKKSLALFFRNCV